jgi:hypothetical protein
VPYLVDALGTPAEQVLVARGGWAGGKAEVVWEEMAWRPDATDALTARLDEAEAVGLIVAWSVVVAGTQRSFVRAAPALDAAFDPAPALAVAPTRVSLHGPVSGMDLPDYHAAFRQHCVVTEEHMRLAIAYRQTEVVACHGVAERTAAGISEFWFATAADAVRMYADDTESAAVGAHAREFVAAGGAVTIYGEP